MTAAVTTGTVAAAAASLVVNAAGGELHRVGALRVAVLHGTYRRMGEQYGVLLRDDIRSFAALVPPALIASGIVADHAAYVSFGRHALARHPERIRALLAGMATGSGLDLAELAALNALFELIGHNYGFQCANVAAWGDWTPDGAVVVGRNFDFHPLFRQFNRHLVIVVYCPSEGGPAAAVLTHAGQLGGVQAFNSRGLIVSDNDGSNCGDNRRIADRRSLLHENLLCMLDCSTEAALDTAIQSMRPSYPILCSTASPQQAAVYEMSTENTRRRGDAAGLLVATNHFVDATWPAAARAELAHRPMRSHERADNLARLCQAWRGRLDAAAMQAVLEVPLASCGARFPEHTIYQWVAVPERLELHVRPADEPTWTRVDLARFMKFAP